MLRARVAAGLARSWVYGNDAKRAAPFASEAVQLATSLGDPAVLADALDAQLASCWGPDDLAERLHISAQLSDVAAHVDDPRTRLDAVLWRLTTALETLDVVGVQRQLAALDVLAAETGSSNAVFFATSRRAMYTLLIGDFERSRELMSAADAIGFEAGIPDAYAVQQTLLGELARHTGDIEALRGCAEVFEAHAIEHGIQSLLAETSVLWLEAGDTARAERLVKQAVASGLDSVPRDVDWMLTVAKIVDAASGCGLIDVAREGMELMAPYAGRTVLNAGAVVCHGVVEDYLYQAAALVGDPRADDWRAAAAAAYQRLDAPWWLRRVAVERRPPVASADELSFRPVAGGAVWSIGPVGGERLVPDMKGLQYLRTLLQRPGVDVPALDLVAMVTGSGATVEQAAVEDVDVEALRSYRQRLRHIDSELDEATEWADEGRTQLLQNERDALLAEIGRATGLSGRPRATGGSGERARVAVRKAIDAALKRIEADDPVTARSLRTTVRTGATCRYDPVPEQSPRWQT